jgi:FlaA1/EpsC-like NDP-sugar epimerase
VPLVAPTLPGVALIVAQTARQITNYVVYRRGGDVRRFKRQTHRLVVFFGVGAGTLLMTRDPAPWLTMQGTLIVAWVVYRVVRERLGSLPQMLVAFGRRLSRERDSGTKPVGIIFGAGLGGARAVSALASRWRLIAVCDNNPAKRGTMFAGLPVIHPGDLAQHPQATIHLAAFLHYHEMYTQLRALGVPDERIRFFPLKSP